MLSGPDVINLECTIVEFLGELTVFTAATCSLPYLPDKGCIHAVLIQEVAFFLSLTPSVRRALDFKIPSTSPALPKASSCSFSSAVRASS